MVLRRPWQQGMMGTAGCNYCSVNGPHGAVGRGSCGDDHSDIKESDTWQSEPSKRPRSALSSGPVGCRQLLSDMSIKWRNICSDCLAANEWTVVVANRSTEPLEKMRWDDAIKRAQVRPEVMEIWWKMLWKNGLCVRISQRVLLRMHWMLKSGYGCLKLSLISLIKIVTNLCHCHLLF